MLESLPQSIWNELHAAQSKAAAKQTRLRVEVNGESYRIQRMTNTGFSLDLEDAPKLRGLVDIFDGGRHVSQCLIVAAAEDGNHMVYEFKRNTAASDGAPLDFERKKDAPIALLGR
ncbi:hypothetical protein Q4555_08220 [Octadecabacter sp. 1_MG-2023]|uniref:hypothetical protein n=1 Tax=unclassified Octadecabacter TaxID=196158 RepID=UPI001C089A6A|nr:MULTISPECIES: hypothetical protein [unclassified Octadecabacter]MBU2992591.1 hypothetical protein [Octadecabacter sp. B2R22]MDO6734652.1 hypothetical protein [Octadecabacter sp. 1_MG-2023]